MFRGAERLLGMEATTLFIESTRNCGQTPRVLVLLEELAVAYELRLRADGYFFETYGRPGPRLVEGDLTLFESPTMLRHCARTRSGGRLIPRSPRELTRVDRWLDCSGWLGLTVAREGSSAGRAAARAFELASVMAPYSGGRARSRRWSGRWSERTCNAA